MEQSHIIGSLLGTAVGDAIGLPYEGLSPSRAVKLLGLPDRHRLLFGFGMVSDDTEHTCMVVQSLIAAGGDVEEFQRQLAWRLRLWLLSLPAGVGQATLLAILRLWLGFSPNRSGVYSAGNGPAMRSAILGVVIREPNKLREFVKVTAQITHTDSKAEYGAFAIALAAQMACQNMQVTGKDFLLRLKSCLSSDSDAYEFLSIMSQVATSIKSHHSTLEFATSLGLRKGVSGYVYHSIPVAIHAWLSHQDDFRTAVMVAVRCGGDTDSVAAMVGGIVGASVGKDGIPTEWLNKLLEPVWSVRRVEVLAQQLDASLHTNTTISPIKTPILLVLLRNFCFLLIVLAHGLRRLFPPY